LTLVSDSKGYSQFLFICAAVDIERPGRQL
jgi:hypothetical protein